MSTHIPSSHTSLVARSLDLAAGLRVDAGAYYKWDINLAKLQCLGKAYRKGWLHNVLRRITPLTARQIDDYVMMADLFVTGAAESQIILGQMSRDLSMFATAVGASPQSGSTPQLLQQHIGLYNRLAEVLSEKFGFQAPAPYASTTLDADAQAEMSSIRQLISRHIHAA